MSKLEADLEVSIMEIYYSAKSCVCEYEKGSVCRIVAIDGNLKFKNIIMKKLEILDNMCYNEFAKSIKYCNV